MSVSMMIMSSTEAGWGLTPQALADAIARDWPDSGLGRPRTEAMRWGLNVRIGGRRYDLEFDAASGGYLAFRPRELTGDLAGFLVWFLRQVDHVPTVAYCPYGDELTSVSHETSAEKLMEALRGVE